MVSSKLAFLSDHSLFCFLFFFYLFIFLMWLEWIFLIEEIGIIRDPMVFFLWNTHLALDQVIESNLPLCRCDFHCQFIYFLPAVGCLSLLGSFYLLAQHAWWGFFHGHCVVYCTRVSRRTSDDLVVLVRYVLEIQAQVQSSRQPHCIIW